MYCTHCGVQVAPHALFCPSCGGAQPGNVSNRRLMRPVIGRKVGGVCIAIANYLEVDVTLVRVIAVLAMLVPPFPAVLVYLICWLVIPSQSDLQPMPAPPTPPPAPAQPQSQP
jgi:phage shock protein C